MTTQIYELSLPKLTSQIFEWNEPSFRAQQIWHGLYCNYWISPSEFSYLPARLRDKLNETYLFECLKPISVLKSSDNRTIKTLFQLSDGKAIETVLMRYEKRNTLCISTQVGCAMGCVFCATGQMGFTRSLSSGEIVAQVMFYARQLKENGGTVTNVVVMGMGEPFHNYENTLVAIDRLNDPDGYNFGARRITISTVGLIPAIRRFSAEKRQTNMAISLHAADNALRTSMLPINKRYPIEELLEACREYVQMTRRRVTFEWALINEVNDTPEQAHRLANILKDLLCHINAIPLNPTQGFSGKATTRHRARIFKEILESHGVPCTIRLRRGIDIQAGCGQLVIKE
jgi:23S rRNA (adenine2503-C2)-methyltransferase